MSATAASADEPPPQSAAADRPTSSGRLLSLVRRLIDYGSRLAATFRQSNSETAEPEVAIGFGTSSIVRIVARIVLALHRARLLEARIVSIAPRLDAATPTSPPPPRTPRSGAPRVTRPRPPLAQLPPLEQIAAKLRRQPIGEVLADICRDLGIVPTNPLWRELQEAINRYGGNFARLFKNWLDRAYPIAHIVARLKRKPAAPPPPVSTGPPASPVAQPA
jgi:hypothetical protein